MRWEPSRAVLSAAPRCGGVGGQRNGGVVSGAAAAWRGGGFTGNYKFIKDDQNVPCCLLLP